MGARRSYKAGVPTRCLVFNRLPENQLDTSEIVFNSEERGVKEHETACLADHPMLQRNGALTRVHITLNVQLLKNEMTYLKGFNLKFNICYFTDPYTSSVRATERTKYYM